MFKTCDLYDEHLEALQVVRPVFRDFGGRSSFYGQMVCLQAFEDNSLLKQSFSADGRGKVLVVDTSASLRCAMMGDQMAALAVSNGWEGVLIHGCIRDSAAVAKLDFGVRALATTPRKTIKRQQGVLQQPLYFADVVFRPNEYLYADEDGIVLSSKALF